MRVPVRMVAQGSSATPKPQRTRGIGLGVEHTGDRQTQELQRRMADATARARFDPLALKVLIPNVVFATGQTQLLYHGLGTPYTGWIVTRALGNPASLIETGLPSGVSASKALALTSPGVAGTYDILVFASP